MNGFLRRRFTLRWFVGRIITAAVIALVFLAADYARAAEPIIEGYEAYRPSWGGAGPVGTGASQATACEGFGPAAVDHYPTYTGVVNSSYNGDGCDVRLERNSGGPVDIIGVVVVPVMVCEDGTQPINGECPEEECEAGDIIYGGHTAGLGDSALPPSISEDGCEYIPMTLANTPDGCGGTPLADAYDSDPVMSYVGLEGNDQIRMNVAYCSTGESNEVSVDGGVLPYQEMAEGVPFDVSPEVTETETLPTVTESLGDGSQKTTDVTTVTQSGGGTVSGNVSGDSRGTFTVVENSTTATTTTVEKTFPAGGGSATESTVSTIWANGNKYTITRTSNGSVTTTVIEGASGSETVSTTRTVSPDGTVTESTTKESSGGESVCDGESCDSPGAGDGEGEGEGPGDPEQDLESPGLPSSVIELPEISMSGPSIGSGAGCMAPDSLDVLTAAVQIDFTPFCDMASIVGVLIVACAWLFAARLVGGIV